MREHYTMEEITAQRAGDLPWDFDVRKEALQTHDGRFSGSYAISRTDTGSVLGTCSQAYEPVNYRNIFEPVMAWLYNQYDNHLEVVYQDQKEGGEASWEIIFGGEIPIGEASEGDILRRSILVQSSHNLTRGIWVSAGVRVLACSNGMVIPRTEHTIQSRHMNWDRAGFDEKINALLQASVAHHDGVIETFRDWKDTPIDAQHGYPIFAELKKQKLPKGYLNDAAEALLKSFQGKSNIWEVYNALTDTEVNGMDNLFSMAKITPKVYETLVDLTEEDLDLMLNQVSEPQEERVVANETIIVPSGSLAQD